MNQATVDKLAFVNALGHIKDNARGPSLSLSGCVLLELEAGYLRLSSMRTGELDLSLTLPADTGLMGETPAVAVPVATLHELARNMPSGRVELTITPSRLDLRGGSNEVHLSPVSLDDVDLPGLHADYSHGTEPFTLNITDLKAALDAVKYAVSSENFQAVMRGVHMEFGPDGVRLVGSDGYRLAVADLQAAAPHKMSALPLARLIVSAVKVMQGEHCAVSVKDDRLIFRTASASIRVPLLDGDYADYKRVLPAVSGHTCTLPAASLSAAVSRASIMSDKNANNRIEFLLDPEDKFLRLCAEGDYGRVDETLEMKPGNELEARSLGFNARYLLEALAGCTGVVTLDLGARSGMPIRVTSGTAGVVAVVVPLRA